MIIYPAALLNSELVAGRPMTHSRIGYRNLAAEIDGAVITVSGELVGAPKDALIRPGTAEYWQGPAFPLTWKIDLLTLQSIGFIGLGGHDLGTTGCTILTETSEDDVVWTTWAESHAPVNNSAITFLDTPRDARYIRFTITGSVILPKIAVAYMGPVLVMERPIFGAYKPMLQNRETILKHIISQGGQFVGQVIRKKGLKGDVPFKYLSGPWYKANFDPFVQDAREKPFFFMWNPETYPEDVAYVWSTEDILPTYTGELDFIEVRLKLKGVGHD